MQSDPDAVTFDRAGGEAEHAAVAEPPRRGHRREIRLAALIDGADQHDRVPNYRIAGSVRVCARMKRPRRLARESAIDSGPGRQAAPRRSKTVYNAAAVRKARHLCFAVALVCALLCLPAVAGAAAITTGKNVVITVLSDRADLISGGNALVAITVPAGQDPRKLTISAGTRNVTREFATRKNGQFEGLVSGLAVGLNVLTAELPDGHGARITITNHPNGGPVFSGPQIEPWTCQVGATDKQCDEPPKYTYLYESTNPTKAGLQPYDPAHPPSDVATTTTDAGVKVPFIVREETGFEDRDEYRVEVLWQPGKSWQPWAPQSQWDHKVLIMHGYDCITAFEPTTPPFADAAGTLPANAAVPDSSQEALGMGFMVMSTALDNSDVDCNPALQAESLVMLKEHVVETYGPIDYTIGTGCSGGSLAQQWIANAYPGIYQGLIVQCSFPDAGSTGQQIIDYEGLGNYFSQATGWTEAQEAEVDGTASFGLPLTTNATFSASAFFPFVLPNRSGCPGISATQEYNAQTNFGGVRCGILDWDTNLLGPQSQSVWDAQEKALGHGFAGSPIDNVGVQYGLAALNSGEITPAQFIDVNQKIGGFNIDWQPQPQRMVADEPALANAYRTGIINEGNNLNQVAIVDLRGPNDPGLAHDSFRSFAVRARLDQNFGTHANQVIWEGPVPLLGDVEYDDQALVAMNSWLEAVSKDASGKSLPQKVIADKPSDVTDQCSDGAGNKISSNLCPSSVVPVYGTPRTVAGEAISTDQNKCALVPLDRGSYKVTFTDAQWSQLQTIFSSGVCDYSKPGVSQQPTVAWLTYQNAQGKVIYGGKPLGAAPASVPFGPAAACLKPTGRLAGRSLGPVKLGMTRTKARSLFIVRTSRGRRYMDFFCPHTTRIRAGFSSPKLLRSRPKAQRARLRGRVVLLLTASPHYALHGVRPGLSLTTVAARLHAGKGYTVGLNTWYLAPNGPSRGVLKVRHGRIEEIGIANKQLTATRRAARVFLTSFS
jgi:hypothetical protein